MAAEFAVEHAMSLSSPEEREPIHHRRIDCRGYRRKDGLWDIEGHLTDVKSYAFPNKLRGEIQPGEPLHDMWLRLTLDDSLTVIRAEAATAAAPFAVCPAITPAFAKLEGLKIGPGWRRAVAQLLGGIQGCTHLVELLGPLATTAYQTIHTWNAQRNPRVETDRPPSHLNTCHALARDGDVVKEHYPKWYVGEEKGSSR
ncbi:MAG: DUF2889 domain-containing protein [Alphaproteobacteria bacterium]